MNRKLETNLYWQSRSWAYEHLRAMPTVERHIPSEDDDGTISTLQAPTQIKGEKLAFVLTTEELQQVRQILALCQDLGSEIIAYQNARVHLRPTAGRLLRSLRRRDGEPMSTLEAGRIISGGRGSMYAIRMAAFRLSGAFNQIKCPLRACCRESMVFLEPSSV
jgi:hypothetical protein